VAVRDATATHNTHNRFTVLTGRHHDRGYGDGYAARHRDSRIPPAGITVLPLGSGRVQRSFWPIYRRWHQHGWTGIAHDASFSRTRDGRCAGRRRHRCSVLRPKHDRTISTPMTHQRDRIREFVAANPGVHFNKVKRSLDLGTGQVQYHLGKLEQTNEVVGESFYGRTHYYTPDYGEWERGALAVLRRETARDILVYLFSNGPTAPKTVAEGLEIARSTLEWHLDHLVEQELVIKKRDAQNHVTLELAHPGETTRMLQEVNPSIANRVVDRFTRLVDGLLETDTSGTDS